MISVYADIFVTNIDYQNSNQDAYGVDNALQWNTKQFGEWNDYECVWMTLYWTLCRIKWCCSGTSIGNKLRKYFCNLQLVRWRYMVEDKLPIYGVERLVTRIRRLRWQIGTWQKVRVLTPVHAIGWDLLSLTVICKDDGVSRLEIKFLHDFQYLRKMKDASLTFSNIK